METGSDLHTVSERRDTSFQPESGQRYQLSLLTGKNFIQAAVLDVILNRYLYLGYYQFNFDQQTAITKLIKHQADIFTADFKRVQISLAEPAYTLVPGSLYNLNQASDYLNLLHSDFNKESPTCQDRLRNFDIQSIYSPAKDWTAFLKDTWKNAVIRHHITSLLDVLHINFRNSDKPVVFIHLAHRNLDIVILEGRQLKFCNSFYCPQDTDVIYHTLAVLEATTSGPDRNLLVSGDFHENPELFNEFKNQIPDARKSTLSVTFKLAPELQDLNQDRYYLLLNQYRVI